MTSPKTSGSPSEERYEPRRFWSDRLEREFTLRGTGHISYSEAYNAWLYRAKRRTLRRALASVGRGPALDIGSGTGWVVTELLRRGTPVEGCDIAPNAVTRLRRSFPAVSFFELELGAERAPRPDASYDLLTALDVLYHVTDDEAWRAAVAEIARLLHPGGWAIVSDGFGEAGIAPAPHVCLRSMEAWEDAARSCGLRIVSTIPLYRWLSREVNQPLLRHLPGGLRGGIQYFLEVAVPRRPHMRWPPSSGSGRHHRTRPRQTRSLDPIRLKPRAGAGE
jgi:SAM-dependent methyltransferase